MQNPELLKKPGLTLADRIDRIKSKNSFSLLFPFIVLVFIVLLFGVLTKMEFYKTSVIISIFNQSLIVGTIAVGVSFIYSTGDIDFSVGNVMGLAATIGALSYQFTNNMVVLIMVTIAVGTLLMLFNCTLSLIFNVKSAMVAIIAMILYGAITTELVGVDTLKVDYNLCRSLESDGFRYVSFILYFVIAVVIFHYTAIGRKLRFIGGNEECAKQSGISFRKSKYIGFLIAGIGVGLAGVFQIARSGSVTSSVGSGMGMDVMLATVLGGMSIFGGAKSNAYSGFLGALTVSALNKGLLMVGISASIIQGVRGLIFLLLVFLNSERPSTLPSRQQF